MFKLSFSQAVRQDIRKSVQYIREELEAPMAANSLKAELKEKYKSLKANPFRRPLVQDAVLAANGYRSIHVKKYLLFYIVDEEAEKINLIRFMHESRDWMNILGDEAGDGSNKWEET
jgi:addiction module RelE/StbE family toxin